MSSDPLWFKRAVFYEVLVRSFKDSNADGVGDFDSPRPTLLRKVTGIEPELAGVHVLLDEHAGVRSIQRLALAEVGGRCSALQLATVRRPLSRPASTGSY